MSMALEQAITQYGQCENFCKYQGLAVSLEELNQITAWLRELQERRKQPETIKCKDCAYYGWDCVDAPYGMTKMICWCDLHYDAGNENLVVNPDDYCKWAERKADG